jgi:hypothetical protein
MDLAEVEVCSPRALCVVNCRDLSQWECICELVVVNAVTGFLDAPNHLVDDLVCCLQVIEIDTKDIKFVERETLNRAGKLATATETNIGSEGLKRETFQLDRAALVILLMVKCLEEPVRIRFVVGVVVDGEELIAILTSEYLEHICVTCQSGPVFAISSELYTCTLNHAQGRCSSRSMRHVVKLCCMV